MDIKNYCITVFGDSISEGIVTECNTVKRLQQNAVNIIEAHFDTKIFNRSSFGMTLSRLTDKKVFENYLNDIDPSKNNVAVICLGGNDSDYDWKQIDKNPTGDFLQKTPLPEFGRLLTQTVDLLTKKNVRIVLVTIPPINPYWYIDNHLTKIADKNNILTFLHGDELNMYRDQERYSAEIMRVAVKTDCELIDLRSLLLLEKDYNTLLCMDGIHPNQEGQKRIAKIIIDIIQKNKIYNKIY